MANEIYDNTWWGVALDTAPSIGTKPDLFGSQFKMLTSEQDNLVTNGDFATDSDWSLGNGWDISNGSLNGVATTGLVFQNFSGIIVGKTYKASVTVGSYTSGVISFKLGNDSYQNISSNLGVQEFYFTASTTGGFVLIPNSPYTGSIDNVSVQLVRAEAEPYGAELVTNGDFENDSDWNKSASVVISDSKITTTVTSGGYQYFTQPINYEFGKQYKLVIKVNGDDGFACVFYDASGNNGGLKNSDGLIEFNGQDQVIELDFIANNNSNTILCSRSGSGNFSYSIDNVSVKEVQAHIEAKKCLADWIHRTALQELNN